MATFENLPSDVIQQILNNIPECSPQESNTPWEYALDFLSICHSWRLVAAKQLYRYAFIRIYFGNKPTLHTVVGINPFMIISTNVELAIQNGFKSAVQRINICINVTDDISEILPGILFGLLKPHNIDQSNVHLSDEAAISYFVRSFPNISHVSFVSKSMHESTNNIFDKIIGQYAEQLTGISYNSQTCTLKHLLTTKPVDFTASLSRMSAEWTSIIHPDSLKSIDFRLCNVPFKWGIFYENGGPGSIVFNNLHTLRIAYLEYLNFLVNEAPTNLSHSDDELHINVEFPKLQKLVLKDIQLSELGYSMLFRSPAEELQLIGRIEMAMPLCNHDISNLKIISLELANYNSDLPEATASDLNRLFQHARGVTKLYCSAYRIISQINLERVYWPNLTNLTVRDTIDFEKLLKSIPSMPNLVHLTLIPTNYSENHTIFAEAAHAFKTLRDSNIDPALFSIECLTFVAFPFAQYDVVDEALGFLRQFLPRLKTVIKDLERL